MTMAEHKARHIELHKNLDELMADWINHTGVFHLGIPIMELMAWSYKQTIKPDEKKT